MSGHRKGTDVSCAEGGGSARARRFLACLALGPGQRLITWRKLGLAEIPQNPKQPWFQGVFTTAIEAASPRR